ncbi:MAG: hypothetical protein R3F61_24675 [Myxococcota bacterium]
MLAPTPDDQLCDAEGRPYFLWDVDLTLADLEARLADPDHRAYWLATLLRQAKPDDVFRFVTLDEIARDWDSIERGLGRQRDFWEWRIRRWKTHGKPTR